MKEDDNCKCIDTYFLDSDKSCKPCKNPKCKTCSNNSDDCSIFFYMSLLILWWKFKGLIFNKFAKIIFSLRKLYIDWYNDKRIIMQMYSKICIQEWKMQYKNINKY